MAFTYSIVYPSKDYCNQFHEYYLWLLSDTLSLIFWFLANRSPFVQMIESYISSSIGDIGFIVSKPQASTQIKFIN